MCIVNWQRALGARLLLHWRKTKPSTGASAKSLLQPKLDLGGQGGEKGARTSLESWQLSWLPMGVYPVKVSETQRQGHPVHSLPAQTRSPHWWDRGAPRETGTHILGHLNPPLHQFKPRSDEVRKPVGNDLGCALTFLLGPKSDQLSSLRSPRQHHHEGAEAAPGPAGLRRERVGAARLPSRSGPGARDGQPGLQAQQVSSPLPARSRSLPPLQAPVTAGRLPGACPRSREGVCRATPIPPPVLFPLRAGFASRLCRSPYWTCTSVCE